jgi:hypothetical protein
MGKRSDYNKIPKDYYPTTDPNAIPPKFIEFIRGRTYAEPCCGEGDLTELLMDVAVCRWESDVEYRGCGKIWDAMCLSKHELQNCDLIVTNPPFSRDVLLPMVDHFITLKPTWLLLPADYMHNKYFSPYMAKCSKVVSVGRLKWFKDSKHTSTDNFCWYFWQQGAKEDAQTTFYGRS